MAVAQLGRQVLFSNTVGVDRLPAPQHPGTIQVRSLGGVASREPCYFAKLPNIEVDIRYEVRIQHFHLVVAEKGVVMKRIAETDLRDISIMVGLASLTGAVANIAFSAITGSPAPQAVAIAITATGFVGGRFLSERIKRTAHE